jgi:hypothetical protein
MHRRKSPHDSAAVYEKSGPARRVRQLHRRPVILACLLPLSWANWDYRSTPQPQETGLLEQKIGRADCRSKAMRLWRKCLNTKVGQTVTLA